MNESLLNKFYLNKELRKEVYDFITASAKELLVEYATKQQPTDWFRPLLETLQDSDKKLIEMFEVTQPKKNVNRAK